MCQLVKSQEYHQHVLQDNRHLNVQVSTDPLVVAQAHQAVADARNDAFQYACHVQSQAQEFALEVQTQANGLKLGILERKPLGNLIVCKIRQLC